MAEQYIKLQYIVSKPIWIPRLKKYPGGVTLPVKGWKKDADLNTILVTASEKKALLKIRNGSSANSVFIEKRQPRKAKEEEIMEDN